MIAKNSFFFIRANAKNGGVDLDSFRVVVDAITNHKMSSAQWEELKSYLPMKSEGVVNYKEFMNYFSKPWVILPLCKLVLFKATTEREAVVIIDFS